MQNKENGLQFAHWVFFVSQDELLNTHTAERQKLEPQVARLLALFLENQEKTLSKETLSELLWPNTIVEANSLYQLLTKLRKVLADAPKQPKFIKTVPKKGYMFIAPVSDYSPEALPVVSPTAVAEIPPEAQAVPKPKSKLAQKTNWLVALPVLLVFCFSAIAFFSNKPAPFEAPTYSVEDISYELGLEFDVSAHTEQNLLAYVSQFKTLVITNKQGQALYEHEFATRVAHPNWHPTEQKLAFWQYIEDKCQLHIMSDQGQSLHRSELIACDGIDAPVWHNQGELILPVYVKKQGSAYLYRPNTEQLVKVPVPLNQGDNLITALSAWDNKPYYLITDKKHHSKLITLDGTVHLTWPYPVWLVAFDPQNKTIISNDETKYNNLVAFARDGHRYPVMPSTQGMFSTLSIDNQGDIFAAAENWQVNIRDKDNLPIFSSSSVDFLPVSNLLGETAFMSRRTGVCEVYLHAGDKVKQLSFDKGHDYVSLLEWSPEQGLLLSNRDNKIVIYDRNRTQAQFDSKLPNPLMQAGWLDNQTIWATDNQHVYLYNLNGDIISKHLFESHFLAYHHSTQQWIVMHKQAVYLSSQLDNAALTQPLMTLKPKQANNFRNMKVHNNAIYWLSKWSMQDYIWQLDIAQPEQINLIKQGSLIWHYDIKPDGSLLTAQMESIEGDIKRFVLKH